MEKKKCSKCGEIKEYSEFNQKQSRCKPCQKEYAKKYRQNNKEKSDLYRASCKEHIALNAKRYALENKEHIALKQKGYREVNKEKTALYQRIYHKENRSQITIKAMQWRKDRLKTDLRFKIKRRLRSRIYDALKAKRVKKTTKSMALIGCSIDLLKQHIESQFTDGMTWGNWSFDGWHIDHIIPCASFDLTDPEQQKICFHYTNLQPLWAEDNLSKSDKLDWTKEAI